MSEQAAPNNGQIGPNAILQLLPLIDKHHGLEQRGRFLTAAGIAEVPDGSSMIPEDDAARLHRLVRMNDPALAPQITAAAGVETANYILANRIPKPAQWLLQALPTQPAAKMLSRAIAQHSWTFAGSGRFRALDPWTFELENNPLIKGEASDTCLCHWHAAVFERLYQCLVAPSCTCVETQCAAQRLGQKCRFEIRA